MAGRCFDSNEQRAFLGWLTRHGPFWEDIRRHGSEDLIECRGEVVTETAVGEAAFCRLKGIDRRLVSVTPSDWETHPIQTRCHAQDGSEKAVSVDNYWQIETVEQALRRREEPPKTWKQVEKRSKARCLRLVFAEDAFAELEPHPFISGAAERILFLLDTLDELMGCVDPEGNRTARGHEIYQQFFTGKKGEGGRGALFSDSSQREKDDPKMRARLTFAHPSSAAAKLFCPWHGKVQTPQLRVHFAWPERAGDSLIVVYVGPKLTSR